MDYYHVSSYNHDGETFKPRVPDNTMYGENVTKRRVCFSTSITGCLNAINVAEYLPYCDDMYYVHVPLGYHGRIVKPTKNDVPDVKYTREKWFVNKVKMKCIGKIKVHNSSKRGIIFKWIEQYDN